MKKTFTTLLLAGFAFTASAQYQIQNGNFEEWENVGSATEEPAHWNSFKTASGSLTSFGKKQVEKLSENAPGSNGSACVRVFAASTLGVVAQGNLTTGQINMGSTNATDASGNYNYTNTSNANFNQKFNGLPDAMQLYVWASCQFGAAASCNLHTEGYFQDPSDNTNTARLVAKADNSSISNTDTWQLVTIPFTYSITDGTRPAYALVTLTTSGQAGKGNKNDFMKADDVRFLYYSEIATATFDGNNISFANGTATVKATYDASKLALTSNGQGATIETQFDGDKTLTVTVKGDNISEDPTNQHVYTIVFDPNAEGGGEPIGPVDPVDPVEPIVSVDGENFLVLGGSFENWKGTCGSTYQTGGVGLRQRPGVEPANWNGSSINQKVSLFSSSKELIEAVDGPEGGTAVRMKNIFVGIGSLGSTAPGFITYGTPWVHAEMTISNCAGGVYGGLEYSKRPDAIRGYFRRTTGQKGSEQAHIIAYLWRGTFQSTIGSKDRNTSEDAEDNDRAIMGLEESTGNGLLVASMDYTFESTQNNDWEVITVPFTYKSAEAPEKMNIIISSADYWNRDNIKDGNILDADSVQFVFFTDLASATYDGQAIPFENNAAELVGTFDETKLSLQAHGAGASVETSYDADSRVLTITVKGGNYAADETNSQTYTVTFRKPSSELASVTYNGSEVTLYGASASVDEKYDPSLIAIAAVDPAATVETSFNEESALLTITVKGADVATDPTNIHTYTVQFKSDEEEPEPIIGGRITLEGTHTYTDNLDVAINGESSGGQQTDIIVTFNNGTLDLALNNFNLASGEDQLYVGNVQVQGVPYTIKDGIAYATFSKATNVEITEGDPSITDLYGEPVMWMGPMLGEIPLTLQGKVGENKLYCNIDIEMLGVGTIHVTFGNDSNWPAIGGGGVDPKPDPIIASRTYTGRLSVTVNGESNDDTTATVECTANEDGTFSLELQDFFLSAEGETTPIGNIKLNNISSAEVADRGYCMFMSTETIQITDGSDEALQPLGPGALWVGPYLGEMPATVSGKIAPSRLYMTISIYIDRKNILVTFGDDFVNAIKSTEQTAAANGVIYDINGRARGTNLNALPRGLYIIGGKKIMK